MSFMNDVSRRDMFVGFAGFALLGAEEASGVGTQVHASEAPPPKPSQPAEPIDRTPEATELQVTPAPPVGGGTLGAARVFRIEDMPAHASSNGIDSRSVTHGTLSTGEVVNLHQTTQPAGAAPVPLHVIKHTEFILIRAGEVAFDHEDANGRTLSEPAKTGDVIYVAPGTKHRLKNTGGGPASYLVVGIGGDAR